MKHERTAWRAICAFTIMAMIGLAVAACDNGNGPDNKPTLASIKITTLPTRLLYAVGETFDPAGMVVTATYSDDSTRTVESGEYALDVPAFDTDEDKTVEVSYAGFADSFTVSVTISGLPRLPPPEFERHGLWIRWNADPNANGVRLFSEGPTEIGYSTNSNNSSMTINRMNFVAGDYVLKMIARGVEGESEDSLPSETPAFTVHPNGFLFALVGDAYHVSARTSVSEDLVIPDTHNGRPVVGIASMAFWDNYLSSVEFPPSITTIETNAFVGNSFNSIVIPESVATIGDMAFRANPITMITLPDNVDITDNPYIPTMGDNGADFVELYNEGGKLAGTYVFNPGSGWARE